MSASPPTRLSRLIGGWIAALLLAGWGASAEAQRLPDRLRYELPEPAAQAERIGAVYAVHQDRTGYLWLATEDGLYRYDGYGFAPFRADPSDPHALPVQRLLDVAETPGGLLWVLADRYGLARFDPQAERFDRFPVDGMQAASGRLAVAPDGSVLFELDGAVARLDPTTGAVDRPAEAAAARAFSAYGGSPVWLADERRAWQMGAPEEPAALPAGASVQVQPAGTWAFDRARWWKRQPSGGFAEMGRVPPAFRVPSTSAWYVDRRGVLWFSNGRGLTACAPAGCREYPDGLPDFRIQEITEDRGGVLWIATAGGVRKLVPRWEAFTAYDLPEQDIGISMGTGARGEVLAAPFCGRSFRLDFGSGAFVPLEEEVPGSAAAPGCPAGFLTAGDGALWMPAWIKSSDGGILRVSPDGRATRRFLTWPDEGPRGNLNALRYAFEDVRGRVWAAGEGGLARFDPTRPGDGPAQRFGRKAGGLPSDIVWHAADARGPTGETGWIWAATYGGGLCRLDPGAGTSACYRHDPDDPASIPSDQVSYVVPVPADSAVWVGTFDGGLARLDERTQRFRRVGTREGLPHPFVRSIVPDGSGRVWIGSYAGLVRVALGADDGPPTIDVFTQADGLPSTGFGLYDALALPDGRFAFGTGRHVVVFHPDSVQAAPFEPPLVLDRLDVMGERRFVGPTPERLEVRYEENLLRFGFTALDFAAPAQTRYAYRMDGFDPPESAEGDGGWTDAADRYATYTNLRPGDYRFRVRARTGSGTWAAQELSIPLVVVPPFWMTNWFRTGSFVLFMLAVGAGASALSRRRYRERMREMEGERQVQAERVRISRDLHDHVGAQLAGLLGEIDLVRLASRRAQQDSPSATPVGPLLDRLESDARLTMTQLRETIWALHREALTLAEFADRLRRFADTQAALCPSPPRFTVGVEGDPETTLRPVAALHLYRIGQEAVRNALRHAGAAELAVTLRQTPGALHFAVQDDGAFKPGTKGAAGDLNGFGLQTMRERAEEVGGTFRLDTTSGTRISVDVPLR